MSASPTYVYRDWKRNFLLRHDLMSAVKELKVESWRLGNESSEDALSWNVFVGLAHVGGLEEAFEVLTGCKARDAPKLFMWGVEVWPTYRARVWSRLANARDDLEPGLPMPTEPDIMLRILGQALVLVEAKFGSANGTLAKKLNADIHPFLDRYRPLPGRADAFNRKAMINIPREHVLEQLCRNVIFSNCLAESNEEAFVANLVRGTEEMDVNDRMCQHLSTEARARFRRVAWEDIARLPSLQRDEATTLRHYLRSKTLRLKPAFKMW